MLSRRRENENSSIIIDNYNFFNAQCIFAYEKKKIKGDKSESGRLFYYAIKLEQLAATILLVVFLYVFIKLS